MIFENSIQLIVRERNPVLKGHAQLRNDPEKLPGIRKMEPPPSERLHFGLRCIRDLPYGRKENEQIQDFPSPSVLWWSLTWGCVAVWREKLLLVTLFWGVQGGCQTILLRVFGEGLKGWEDNEIRCPWIGQDLPSFIAAKSWWLFLILGGNPHPRIFLYWLLERVGRGRDREKHIHVRNTSIGCLPQELWLGSLQLRYRP